MFAPLRLVALLAATSFIHTAFGQADVQVSGRVTNSVHGALPHAAVELRVSGSGEIVASTTTDDEGRFAFMIGPRKAYELQVQSPNFQPTAIPVDGRGVELPELTMRPTACGSSDFQPTCGTLGVIVSSAVVVGFCFFTIIGKLLFRQRPAPLLIASGILIVLAPASIFVPVALTARNEGKLGGAIIVMMMAPVALTFLASGIGCFLIFAARTIYRAVRKPSPAGSF